MDGLHHHNGIIDHNGDGKHKGCEGQKVQREAKHIKEEERTDKRHRHGNKRNKRRTCVLKEHINHDKHEHKRLKQGLDKVLDRSEQELGNVLHHIEVETRGQRLGLLVKESLDVLGNLGCVRTGCLGNHHGHRRLAVKF